MRSDIMNPSWRNFALVVLLSLVSTAVAGAADDPAIKQLEAYGNYQEALSAPAPNAPVRDAALPRDAQATADQLTHAFKMHRESNKVYEIAMLSGLAVISLFLVLRFLSSKGPSAAPHMVSATGLICIVFGTILLVLMVETDQQLTASVGILGAVAGYLFRSMHPDEETKPPTNARNPPP
jgi:hypothetical protein